MSDLRSAFAAFKAESSRPVVTRRAFLRNTVIASTALGIVPALIGLGGCSDSTSPVVQSPQPSLDLSTDAGVSNYAYMMLYVEMQFYNDMSNFPGMLATELNTTVTLRQQVANAYHALQPTQTLGSLVDRLQSVVDYASRQGTLTAAETIADTNAGGLAGAVQYAKASATVSLMASLASDAAQRSAAIRAMFGVSAATITPLAPTDVLNRLAPYYTTKFTVKNA